MWNTFEAKNVVSSVINVSSSINIKLSYYRVFTSRINLTCAFDSLSKKLKTHKDNT